MTSKRDLALEADLASSKRVKRDPSEVSGAAAAAAGGAMPAAEASAPVTCESFTYSASGAACADDLKCTLSMNPIYDPVTHTPCGTTFCRACIAKSKNCPICSAELKVCGVRALHWLSRNEPTAFLCVQNSEIANSPLFIRNVLNALVVSCTECKADVKREALPAHELNVCAKPCARGCGVQLAKSQLTGHDSTCSHQLVDCAASDVGCVFSGLRPETKSHELKCAYVSCGPAFRKIVASHQATIDSLQTQLKTITDALSSAVAQTRANSGGGGAAADAKSSKSAASASSTAAASGPVAAFIASYRAAVDSDARPARQFKDNQAVSYRGQICWVAGYNATNGTYNLQPLTGRTYFSVPAADIITNFSGAANGGAALRK